MRCINCGKDVVDDTSAFCNHCGAQLNANDSKDHSNFGFALLGFFMPVIGLIFFLVYEGKKPKRAKSAGKGALIGFITRIVLAIVLAALYVVFIVSLFRNTSNDYVSDMYAAFGGVG